MVTPDITNKPPPAPLAPPKEQGYRGNPVFGDEPSLTDGLEILFKLVARIPYVGDWLCAMWINSLEGLETKTFDLIFFDAPQPPTWFTEAQKIRCNAHVAAHFCRDMKNFAEAENTNPYVLSYTRFSYALEKQEEHPACHNAFSRNIEAWLQDKTTVHLGQPFEDMKNKRPNLSSDFVAAACPLLEQQGELTELYIHGPVAENDRTKLVQTIGKIQDLAKVHFELEKESARYFLTALPNILKNPTITTITFNNYGKKKDRNLVIPDSTWTKLYAQDQCDITFTNAPPHPAGNHNRLTFTHL